MSLSFSNVVSKILKPGPSLTPKASLFSAPASSPVASNALQSKIAPVQPLAPVVVAPKPIAKPAVQSAAPVPAVNPNGLTSAQLAAGYSTIPGAYDPVTGKLKNSAAPTPVYIPPQQQANATASTKTAAAPEKPTFNGILFDLMQKATQGSQDVTDARNNLTKFQTGLADKVADIRSDDIPLEFQQGRAQVVQQAGAEKEAALQTGVQNALAEQQQQLGALQAAGGLAQPIQSPYSNQVLDPTTGLPVSGGAANGSLTDAVNSITQKVQNGSMSYDAGVDALSGYGQAGVNGLQSALGPNFNVQQSNANAAAQAASTLQTGTTGGVITKAADSANQALTKLEQDFAHLNGLQTGGIPLTNSIANWVGSKFGQGALAAYQTTLADARAQIVGVLTASGASTPTGAEDIAKTYLPDNMTPALLKEKLSAVRSLISQKVASATSATPVANNNGGATGGVVQTSIGPISTDW